MIIPARISPGIEFVLFRVLRVFPRPSFLSKPSATSVFFRIPFSLEFIRVLCDFPCPNFLHKKSASSAFFRVQFLPVTIPVLQRFIG